MKKHTEKPPIDELFARKLGNASLTPASDSFARLQARMGQQKSEPNMVFWRNPDVQRYMAAAACLLLVCLIGWRYYGSSSRTPDRKGDQLATNRPVKPVQEKPVKKEITHPQSEQIPEAAKEEELVREANTNQVAIANNSDKIGSTNKGKTNLGVGQKTPAKSGQSIPVAPMLVQEKPVEPKSKVDVALPPFVAPVTQVTPESVADAKSVVKPSPVVERVLVVTIAEPEALVAARQAAKVAVEEKVALAQREKPEKEAKVDGLWQKVKRIKVFARQDNTDNDESGLLGRAYSGLKHSLEKDKTSKQ